MNFKIFKCYVYVCNSIGLTPSWNGLERFRKFYLWERENNGKDLSNLEDIKDLTFDRGE